MFVKPGLNDSNVNTYETSVGAFVETPLDEDFSKDFNKLKVRQLSLVVFLQI